MDCLSTQWSLINFSGLAQGHPDGLLGGPGDRTSSPPAGLGLARVNPNPNPDGLLGGPGDRTSSPPAAGPPALLLSG
jgi:hypothetical protein